MKKRTYLIFMFSIFMLWFSISEAFQSSFSVSPLHLDFNVDIGNSMTRVITIRNSGDDSVSVIIYKKDFVLETDGSEIELIPGTLQRGCAENISISPVNLTIPPNESRQSRISLEVPENSNGSYWSKIYVEEAMKPEPINNKEGGYAVQVNLKQRWGIAIFEEVPGTEMKDCKISSLLIGRAKEFNKLAVEVKFENTGNVILKCSGYLEIRNEDGETEKKIELENFKTYPENSRNITALIEQSFKFGEYSVLAVIDFGGDHLVAGEAFFEIAEE